MRRFIAALGLASMLIAVPAATAQAAPGASTIKLGHCAVC